MILHVFTGEFIFYQSICSPLTPLFYTRAPVQQHQVGIPLIILFKSSHCFSLCSVCSRPYLRPWTVVSRQHRYLISQFSETILH